MPPVTRANARANRVNHTASLPVEIKIIILGLLSFKDVMKLSQLNQDWRAVFIGPHGLTVYQDAYQALPGRANDQPGNQYSNTTPPSNEPKILWKRRCLTECNWGSGRPSTTLVLNKSISAGAIVDYKIDTQARHILLLTKRPPTLQTISLDGRTLLSQINLSPFFPGEQLEYQNGYAVRQALPNRFQIWRRAGPNQPPHTFPTYHNVVTHGRIQAWSVHGRDLCVHTDQDNAEIWRIDMPAAPQRTFPIDTNLPADVIWEARAQTPNKVFIIWSNDDGSGIRFFPLSGTPIRDIRPENTNPTVYTARIYQARNLPSTTLTPRTTIRRTMRLKLTQPRDPPEYYTTWTAVAAHGDLLAALSKEGNLYLSTTWQTTPLPPTTSRYNAIINLPLPPHTLQNCPTRLVVKNNRVVCAWGNHIFVINLGQDLGVDVRGYGFVIELQEVEEGVGPWRYLTLGLLDDVVAYTMWMRRQGGGGGAGDGVEPVLRVLDMAPARVE